MRRTIGLAAACGAAALMAGVAFQARASVTVIGGGLAQACSKAAMKGASSYRDEQVCSTALDTELLSPRDRAGTYVNRGVMRLRRMDWDGAMKDLNVALKYKPDLGEIYVNRGAVFIAEHKFSEGLADLNKGISLGVEEPQKAYYNRALAYEGLDDVKSAYFDYQKALELAPNWEAPKQELARFHVVSRE